MLFFLKLSAWIIQLNTGKMSSAVVLVAAVLLRWAWHRGVAFIWSIYHIEVSTVVLSRSIAYGFSVPPSHTFNSNMLKFSVHFRAIVLLRERRVIGISGSPFWSKDLMELIFNLCGEFRWIPEGPVSQIHSPHLHAVPLGSSHIF